jgi:hypothetical protein
MRAWSGAGDGAALGQARALLWTSGASMTRAKLGCDRLGKADSMLDRRHAACAAQSSDTEETRAPDNGDNIPGAA